MGKTKTEHPLMSKYNEYIDTVWEYYDALFVYSEFENYIIGPDNEIFRADPKTAKVFTEIESPIPGGINVKLESGKIVTLPGPHSFDYFCKGKLVTLGKLNERVQSLSAEVVKIYRALEPELELKYKWRCLSWACINLKDKDGSLFDKLRKIAWALMELRDRKEWGLEEQILVKTPARQAVAKTLVPEEIGTSQSAKVTFQYNKRENKEGSKKVVGGILMGKKDKHPFTRIPALAFAEYARASNAGIKDPKDIEKRVIDRIPSWQKYKRTGKEPSTKYVKREIKKGIKKATGHEITPFNPIPFRVELPKSQ